jgi:predicted anti-sigma-YlaC factor YlaD
MPIGKGAPLLGFIFVCVLKLDNRGARDCSVYEHLKVCGLCRDEQEIKRIGRVARNG